MAKVTVTFDDYRELAKSRLPRMLFDYIDGGSFSESTLSANTGDLRALNLRQRVLRDVSNVDTSTTVLGQKQSVPLVLAPIGLAGLMARRGEVQAARAAEKAGIPFTLSTVGICSIEEVRKATTSPFWFQLYMIKDRGFIAELIGRAKAAGCGALVLTVDLAVTGTRYRDVRNGMAGGRAPLSMRIGNALNVASRLGWVRDVALGGKPLVFGNLSSVVPNAKNLDQFRDWVASQFDASVTWKDVEWIRTHWDGPLIIKGVLDTDDATEAISAGASGIVVSNHGGRQLDGAPSTIAALPAIADKVAHKCEVLMDGGVRSGQDIARALACGAKAAMIGRAWVLPLAAAGEQGVARQIATMKSELEVTLALLGEPRAAELGRGALVS